MIAVPSGQLVLLVLLVPCATVLALQFCDPAAMDKLRVQHQRQYFLPKAPPFKFQLGGSTKYPTFPLTGIGITSSDIYLLLSQTLFKIPLTNLQSIGSKFNRYLKEDDGDDSKRSKIPQWYPRISEMSQIKSIELSEYSDNLNSIFNKSVVQRFFSLQDSQGRTAMILLVKLSSGDVEQDYVTVVVDTTSDHEPEPYWHGCQFPHYMDDSSFVFDWEGDNGFELLQRQQLDKINTAPEMILSPYFISHIPGPDFRPFVQPTKQFRDTSNYNKVIRLLGPLKNSIENDNSLLVIPIQFGDYLPGVRDDDNLQFPFVGYVGGFVLKNELYLFDYRFVYCIPARDPSRNNRTYWSIPFNQTTDFMGLEEIDQQKLITKLIRIPWDLFFECNQNEDPERNGNDKQDRKPSEKSKIIDPNYEDYSEVETQTEESRWSAFCVVYFISVIVLSLLSVFLGLLNLSIITIIFRDCCCSRSTTTTTSTTTRPWARVRTKRSKKSTRSIKTTSPNLTNTTTTTSAINSYRNSSPNSQQITSKSRSSCSSIIPIPIAKLIKSSPNQTKIKRIKPGSYQVVAHSVNASSIMSRDRISKKNDK